MLLRNAYAVPIVVNTVPPQIWVEALLLANRLFLLCQTLSALSGASRTTPYICTLTRSGYLSRNFPSSA